MKTLFYGPSRGATGMPVAWLLALFLLAAIMPLGMAAWTTGSSGDLATELSAASGILAATLLYLQFLSSGRFEGLSGKIGIDRTMGFHRIAGLAILAFAFLSAELPGRDASGQSRWPPRAVCMLW